MNFIEWVAAISIGVLIGQTAGDFAIAGFVSWRQEKRNKKQRAYLEDMNASYQAAQADLDARAGTPGDGQ